MEHVRVLAARLDEAHGELRSFGGVAFTFDGKIAFAVRSDGLLMARLGKSGVERAIADGAGEPAKMGERTMRGWATLAPRLAAGDDVLSWLALAVEQAREAARR